MKFVFKDYKLLSSSESLEILSIRNSKAIRDISLDGGIIDIQTHKNWILNLPNNSYFAMIFNDEIVGGVNFYNGFWGIFYKSGVEPLIKSAFAYLFLSKILKDSDLIYSKIKLNNQNALRFNQFFGFEIVKSDEIYTLELKKSKFNSLNNRLINRVKSLADSSKVEFI
ncbi:hypothetical protein V2I28_02340 [Campylobacter sp. CX2-4080-23]|uniref:hypothetical protein n=1 Tax=Campylobacter porcelli TaxID=1660073 RepID=UPI002EA50A24|nr:hypothetical protein [Campylobacter sp. CX2-4080-23]